MSEKNCSAAPFVLDISSPRFAVMREKASAVVHAEAQSTVRREMFGDQLTWRGNGYGIYEPETDSFNEKLARAVRECGVTTLRYPGGIQGDFFRWRETVGEERTPQIDPFSDEYPTLTEKDGERFYPHFGWDEFLRLCKYNGQDAVVQLNAGNGTPEEAAALVRYCERADCRVASYCIGNEVCFKGESVHYMKVNKTPEQYIRFCLELFELIADIRDDICIGIIGMPTGHRLSYHPDWNEKVLTALGDKIDFIDCHIGYSVYFAPAEQSADEICRAHLACAEAVKRHIEKIKRDIAVYGGKNADRIEMQITEWGPLGPYGNSMPGTVFLASVLQVMLNEPRLTAASHLPMLNAPGAPTLVGYRVIDGTEYIWDNTATHAFRMYSEQIGRRVLKTDFTCLTVNTPRAVGFTPIISGADSAGIAVYFDDSTGRGSIFTVNQMLDKNTVFDIRLPFDKIKIEKVTELYSDDLKLTNSPKDLHAVEPKVTANESGICAPRVILTAKPVSVVKTDFCVCE
ncbi:MAG: hypothetical protein IJN63_09035 [Clostridia bacterium]|nr:hypothetical protein [Clostridia bacterium]